MDISIGEGKLGSKRTVQVLLVSCGRIGCIYVFVTMGFKWRHFILLMLLNGFLKLCSFHLIFDSFCIAFRLWNFVYSKQGI